MGYREGSRAFMYNNEAHAHTATRPSPHTSNKGTNKSHLQWLKQSTCWYCSSELIIADYDQYSVLPPYSYTCMKITLCRATHQLLKKKWCRICSSIGEDNSNNPKDNSSNDHHARGKCIPHIISSLVLVLRTAIYSTFNKLSSNCQDKMTNLVFPTNEEQEFCTRLPSWVGC